MLKKDRDDTEGWGAFAGTGGKKKGKFAKKTPAAAASASASATPAESSTPPASTASNNISLPFSTLNTLLGFGISPPGNKDDVPRVISDLSTKKAWFEANQKRKTEEEVERVEKQIQKMLKKQGGGGGGADVETEEPASIAKEVGGEREPSHSESCELLLCAFQCDPEADPDVTIRLVAAVAIAGDATKDISVEKGEQLPETPEERSSSVHQIDHELEQVKSDEQ